MTTTANVTAHPQVEVPRQRATAAHETKPPAPSVVQVGRAAHRSPSYEGTAELALRGDLTTPDGGWLAAELDDLVQSRARTIRIDLSAVTYVNAVITRLLLSNARRLEKEKRYLTLVNAQPKVRRMLKWHGAYPPIVS